MMSSTTQTLEALYATGHWLMQQERHGDAVSLFRTMLLVDARDERGWLALAICHEKLDEIDKAIELCRLAMSACGARAARCMVARARLLRGIGERGEALEAYEQALRCAEAANDDELAELIEVEVRAS
jgi:tetratricopeptide (TPR) repeat protein